jgi:hypothetical protein
MRYVFLTADADWASGQSTINQSIDLRTAESIASASKKKAIRLP